MIRSAVVREVAIPSASAVAAAEEAEPEPGASDARESQVDGADAREPQVDDADAREPEPPTMGR